MKIEFCLWKPSGEGDNYDYWVSGCGKRFSVLKGISPDDEYVLCPYCGAKIEITVKEKKDD